MGKSQSIYVCENVDMIIQRIESQIDLFSKTVYLYDSQFFSKDKKDCSLQYSHIIRELLQMMKPFNFAYGLNYTLHP